jgi:hypothetical protein
MRRARVTKHEFVQSDECEPMTQAEKDFARICAVIQGTDKVNP